MRRLFAVWMAMMASCATAQSLTVSPSVAFERQRIAVLAWFGSCPYVPVLYDVSVKARVISVSYRLEQTFGPCSAQLLTTLGPLPADVYELRVSAIPDDLQPILSRFIEVRALPDPPPFDRIAFVGGDRRLVVAASPNPLGGPPLANPLEFSVRVEDGAGAPLAGVPVALVYAWYWNAFVKTDEFGFSGFGTPRLAPRIGDIAPSDFAKATTGANGVVKTTLPARAGSHVVGAGYWPGPAQARQAFASVVALLNAPTGAPVVAVEFHHAAMGRYVITANDDEVAALDRGAFAGWERSTGAIAVWPTRDRAPFGAVPVCRFFSPVHTSHFYTVDPAECDALEARWPGVWVLETREAFWVAAPVQHSGLCPTRTQPVYRMYRASPGPSHRFVTGVELRDAMIAAGWIFEGSKSNDRGAMCVPA